MAENWSTDADKMLVFCL